MSNIKSQSTTSSVSSRKFNLNEQDTKEILVYKVRHGYTFSSERELCKELDKNPKLRCSRKFIPRGCSRVDVKTQDLFNEPERTKYSKHPNAHSSFASVGLPRKVYWKRLLMGQFQNLYIVSPDNSPSGSTDGSESSSPSATAPGLPPSSRPWASEQST